MLREIWGAEGISIGKKELFGGGNYIEIKKRKLVIFANIWAN